MNISYNKYLWYLTFLKFKINLFIPKNSIEFIVAHYDESFDYLKYLPNNQKITIYCKSNLRNQLPKTKHKIKFFFLRNVGKEYHTYLFHIIKNYSNLAKINFFFSASFLNVKDRTRNFTNVYEKVSSINKKKFKGLYTSHDKYFLFKKLKPQLLNHKMRTYKHKTHKGVEFKILKSKIFPLSKFFYTYFKGKKLDKYIKSLNGIFATNRENIKAIKKNVYKSIIKEYKIAGKDYESGFYLERIYPSIFRLN